MSDVIDYIVSSQYENDAEIWHDSLIRREWEALYERSPEFADNYERWKE